MATRTENGKKAFFVDLQKESPHEDQHQLRMVPVKKPMPPIITYGTNSDLVSITCAIKWSGERKI
jgi:preprotein translocase subunit SecA